MKVPIQFMLFVLLATLLGYATSTPTSAATTTSSHLRHHKPNQHQNQQRSLQQWCGQCFWRGTIVCDARVQYLIDKYTQTQTTARESLIADQTCTSPTGEAERTMSLEAFCGDCQWSQMPFNCDSRVVFLMENYQLSEDKAVEGLLEKGECVDPDYVEGEDNDGDGSVNNKDGGVDGQVIVFCGDCPYPGDCCMTCDEKAESLTEKMTVKEARLEILGECNKLPGEGDNGKNDTNNQNESDSNTGMIVGIVVAILLLILLILLVFFMRRRNRAKEEGIEENNNNNNKEEEEEKQKKKKEEEEEKRKSDIEKDSNIPLVDIVPMAIATSTAIESDPENNPPSPSTLDETTTPGPPPLILPEKTRRSSSRRREQAEVNKAIEDDTGGGDKSDEDAVEIWVPKDVDIEDQSQLTFDDDWSRDPVKVRPDPVGDTNFVNPLPSTMEEEVGASSSGVLSGQQQKLATIKSIRTEDVGDESSPRKGVSVDEFTGLSEDQGNENLGLEKVATADSERAQAPQDVASSSKHAPSEDAIAQRRGSQDP